MQRKLTIVEVLQKMWTQIEPIHMQTDESQTIFWSHNGQHTSLIWWAGTELSFETTCQVNAETRWSILTCTERWMATSGVTLSITMTETQLLLLTATTMWKFTATVSQLLALEEHQLEWLCNHMGHSVQVHRDFYTYAGQYFCLDFTSVIISWREILMHQDITIRCSNEASHTDTWHLSIKM